MEALLYPSDELLQFGESLLKSAGLEASVARAVAEVLLEGDLLGHDTHGLQLLAPYLGELAGGRMAKRAEIKVIAERASIATWDGERMPGPWLVRQAIAWARPRVQMHGSATVVIRRSHHIGCLAAYLEQVARDGLLVLLMCSDPSVASVAPHGGTQAVFTPNPMAAGIPTAADPILVDISASITTNGMTARLKAEGRRGAHPWWLDALGQPTDDPGALFTQPPGTLLPLGGLDAGHKGYGLALIIETLTGGLAGYGRADLIDGWGATVFLQLYDPEAFGGAGAFTWQTDWIAQACRASVPRVPDAPVRLPGERALNRKREQLAQGVALHPGILAALAPWSTKLHVAMPNPL
jgi:LDH2 family malate/lactate/ureidoglycolate dehydrogenase